MQRVWNTLALFGSASTLLCCALPALLVTLGAGAVLAGVVSAVPQLVWLSQHKVGLFIFSAIMLSAVGIARHATRNAPCPVDPLKRRTCQRARRVGLWIYAVSLCLYATGFFFAFIAPYFVR